LCWTTGRPIPTSIEQQIRDADEAERAAEALWQRERRLLS
jgi:hypothetical protein